MGIHSGTNPPKEMVKFCILQVVFILKLEKKSYYNAEYDTVLTLGQQY